MLRRVCKSFRTQADQRIAFHLILRGNQLPIEIHSGLLGERIATINLDNFGHAIRERFPWADKASVLDIDAGGNFKELALLLLAWELKDLKTLRFKGGAPKHVRENLGLPRAERTIYFSADIKVNPDPLTFLRQSIFFSSTVVINKDSPTIVTTAPRRYELSPFCWATYLVVIIKKWDAPVTLPEKVKGHLRAALKGNLGETYHILSAASKGGVPSVIVVGLETLSPGSLGLHAHELGGKSVQEGLRALLKSDWDREREAERQALKAYRAQTGQGSSSGLSFINSKTFRFKTVTVEEYKRVMGEGEWEIETSEEVRYVPNRRDGRRLHDRFFANGNVLF